MNGCAMRGGFTGKKECSCTQKNSWGCPVVFYIITGKKMSSYEAEGYL